MTVRTYLRIFSAALAALTLAVPVAYATVTRTGAALSFTANPSRKPPVVTRFDCAGRHNCPPEVDIIRDHRNQPGSYYVH